MSASVIAGPAGSAMRRPLRSTVLAGAVAVRAATTGTVQPPGISLWVSDLHVTVTVPGRIAGTTTADGPMHEGGTA